MTSGLNSFRQAIFEIGQTSRFPTLRKICLASFYLIFILFLIPQILR
jgi:hypothetical protein